MDPRNYKETFIKEINKAISYLDAKCVDIEMKNISDINYENVSFDATFIIEVIKQNKKWKENLRLASLNAISNYIYDHVSHDVPMYIEKGKIDLRIIK